MQSTLEFHGCFPRSAKFLLQNRAIHRKPVLISLPVVSSEKHAAQRPEKLRKKRGRGRVSALSANE
jgi:hypothetical protein